MELSRYLPLVILGGFFLELAVMIAVGQRIGVLATILLVLASGVLGIAVMKRAGLGLLDALGRPQRNLRFQSREAAERFLLMLAGLLLILPGFISDLVALALLPQPVRAWLADHLMNKVERHGGQWHYETRKSGTVIEGEVVEIEGEIVDESRRP